MKNPPHPGELIRTEVIEALGLSLSKAAEILKIRRATLSDLLHAKSSLTPQMALRIEKAFGPDMNAARLRCREGASAEQRSRHQALRAGLVAKNTGVIRRKVRSPGQRIDQRIRPIARRVPLTPGT
jgi:addiction module HigA family antidote